ncbi:MAG TPA: hypothetical protein VEF04_07930, partial [Blastocatellia bacterium]|nr:hypothetical protein [Blastocatellia bacterium]
MLTSDNAHICRDKKKDRTVSVVWLDQFDNSLDKSITFFDSGCRAPEKFFDKDTTRLTRGKIIHHSECIEQWLILTVDELCHDKSFHIQLSLFLFHAPAFNGLPSIAHLFPSFWCE